mgnify:CR=1 FL=1
MVQLNQPMLPKGDNMAAIKFDNPNELMTIEEVAAVLRCSPRTIYNRVRPGAENKFPIPFRRIAGGRLIRFRRADVYAHVGGE